MAWPKATDFIEAVQDLHVSMEDAELCDGDATEIRRQERGPLIRSRRQRCDKWDECEVRAWALTVTAGTEYGATEE